MAKVKVISPVRHDGAAYAIGQEIKVKQPEAERLALLGVAVILEEEPDQADVNLSALKKDELIAMIEEKGIAYDAKQTKDELIALLEEAE